MFLLGEVCSQSGILNNPSIWDKRVHPPHSLPDPGVICQISNTVERVWIAATGGSVSGPGFYGSMTKVPGGACVAGSPRLRCLTARLPFYLALLCSVWGGFGALVFSPVLRRHWSGPSGKIFVLLLILSLAWKVSSWLRVFWSLTKTIWFFWFNFNIFISRYLLSSWQSCDSMTSQ